MNEGLVRRRPSAVGEYETGCYYHESNDLALVTLSNSELSEAVEGIIPEWEVIVKDIVRKTMTTESEELERISLGTLLKLGRPVFQQAVELCGRLGGAKADYDENNVTRDWFCWLHREVTQRYKENGK